jgi:hypothetical protein
VSSLLLALHLVVVQNIQDQPPATPRKPNQRTPVNIDNDADLFHDYPEKSAKWNNTHAAYLIGVPSPSFHQKTIYAYRPQQV